METYTAKRDYSLHYHTRVFRGDNEADIVCTMKIRSMNDDGTLTIAGVEGEFTFTHLSLSGRWDLRHNGRIVCTSRKISKLRTRYILEELRDGAVVRKMRMQTRKAGSDQMYFSPIALNMSDKDAAKHDAERVFMTVTRKSSMSSTFTLQKKKDDAINPVFFAFLYAMFFTDYKRDDVAMKSAYGGMAANYVF